MQRFNKLRLPEWTDSIFPDKLASLKARAFQLFTETPYMRRIKGGLLITEIIDKMLKKQAGELTQNIFIYSGHDTTIANMVRGLNVTGQTRILPDYGASLIFELHCGDEYLPPHSQCNVKVSYKLLANRSKCNKMFSTRFGTGRVPMIKIHCKYPYPTALIPVHSEIFKTLSRTFRSIRANILTHAS